MLRDMVLTLGFVVISHKPCTHIVHEPAKEEELKTKIDKYGSSLYY